MQNLVQDLRYAIRMLLRSPGTTIFVIVSLGLGIGANTAIFSLLDAVVLRMLPVKDPGQLVQLVSYHPRLGKSQNFSYPAFKRFRDQNEVSSGTFAFSYRGDLNVGIEGPAETASVQLVSGEFFPVLGLEAAFGRVLTKQDDRVPGDHPVAVIGYNYWRRRLGSDAGILNKTIVVNRTSFSIVGVTPRSFPGVTVGESPDIYLPLMMQAHVITWGTRCLHHPRNIPPARMADVL